MSALCLGTMNFATYVSEQEAGWMLDRALDGGVNFVDTADVYGWGPNVGRCESIIGRHLSGRRSRVVLATKLYRGMAEWPNNEGLSALHLRRAADASLRRLSTDYLDLLQFHHFDRRVPMEEVWEAAELLVQQGKVRHFGSSNFAAWHIVRAQAARRPGCAGLVSEQSVFNLLNRFVELDVLPACRNEGLGFLAWSPLCDGLLAGPSDGSGRRAESRNTAKARRYAAPLGRFFSWCDDNRLQPAEVALAWVMRQPGVTSVVAGPRTRQQWESCLSATTLVLDDTQLSDLAQLFPPPG